ncbi:MULTISPECIES: protein kinase domain-containing protein [Shewanella]|nr:MULTISPECIES: protein kinase [Shewanella]
MWREWQAVNACYSACIQKAISIDEHKLVIYLEYYPDSRSLNELKEHEIDLWVFVLPKVIDAIAHCHQQGWVHGDIKPSNILFNETLGIVRLIDFGASNPIGTNRNALNKWQLTPMFSSENQKLGVGYVEEEDDWYALAKMMQQVEGKLLGKI